MHTPDKALEALAAPDPLTLGQVALLTLYKLPIIEGKIDDLNATVFAVWLLSMPLEQAVAEAHFPDRAIVWAEKIGVDEYNYRLVKALNAIARFHGMLPKAEYVDENDDGVDGLKKKVRRRGNGDLAEIAEFVCRIYGWTLHHVLCEVPAVQVALVYRCWQQTAGGLKSATLEMDEIADEMGW